MQSHESIWKKAKYRGGEGPKGSPSPEGVFIAQE